MYHSTTLLLPDGRVLHTGSGDGPNVPRELNAEVFSTLSVSGTEAFVEAPRTVRATLVRLGSVTHGFEQNGQFLELALARLAGGLTLTAPASGTLAPPGDYLLLLLTSAGVPSVGKIIPIR